MRDEELKNSAYDELRAQQAKCASGPKIGGVAGLSEPTLRGRINAKRCRAEEQGRKADRLGELEYLLDKNPEVARILDLLEQVGS